MSDGGRPFDPFERGRRETETFGRALDDLREDAQAMIRDELARAEAARGDDLERRVRRAVEREMRRTPPPAPWKAPAMVAVGVAAGLVVGALGYRTLGPPEAGPAAPDASAATAPAAEIGREPTEPASPPDAGPAGPQAGSPGERAALYDSLFEARSARLEPVVARLEAAGPAPAVADAATAWRNRAELDGAARRRLHDALVQLALNEEAGAGLALDGLLTRGPCGGNSCGALLELWRSRGAELGMPALPDDPANDTPTLAVAERVLVLARAEKGGSAP